MFETQKTTQKKPIIRPAAVAGMFYPADAEQLQKQINAMLKKAREKRKSKSQTRAQPGSRPMALIVPHAGIIYSGQAAADAYAYLSEYRHSIKKVILLGPAHRVAFQGIAGSNADAFATPLGEIPLDQELMQTAYQLEGVFPLDEAHAEEHSLEVQLPFLQTSLDDFSLAPFVVGDATDEQVAQLLNTLADNDKHTLIVISSDLSHFLDYDTATQRDHHTVEQIINLQGDQLGPYDACGYKPVRGLLKTAKDRHLQIEPVTVCNSGDTAGDKRRVVGYASFLLTQP